MAYIIQQRRDTLKNWNEINPVLADSEIGFILDLDENGKQKSSLYKIGDGSTAWKDLPLFGFNGNISKNFTGDDLDITVPTSQSVLDKINDEISKLINGDDNVEGLFDKLSVTQLVQMLSSDISEENTEEIAKDQIVSRWILIQEFQQIWNDFGDMEERIILDEKDIKTLQEFADTFGTSFTTYQEATDKKLFEHDEKLSKHEQDIYGWEEQKETGEVDEETGEPIIETIKHNGIIDDINNINNDITQLNDRFQILSEDEYSEITDFSHYAEGTVFLTYEVKKEE